MQKAKFIKWLQLGILSGVLLISGCSKAVSSPDGNALPVNHMLNRSILIERSTVIPVIDGNPTTSGVYVRNMTDKTISNISYTITHNNVLDNVVLNTSDCHQIASKSSCLLRFTTPRLSKGASGSAIISANFDIDKHISQLINYRYFVGSNYHGVNFSDNTVLFGPNDYTTVYVFAGDGQDFDNVGFIPSDVSISVNNGLHDNAMVNISKNQVLPLEIMSSKDIINNHPTISYYQRKSKGLKAIPKDNLHSANNSNVLEVTVTSVYQGNVAMSNLPILKPSRESAILTLVNNGNLAIDNLQISQDNPVDIRLVSTDVLPCGQHLDVGEVCYIKVYHVNPVSSSSTNINIQYTDMYNGTMTKSQPVTYYASNVEPVLTIIPEQSMVTLKTQTIEPLSFTVTNIGAAPFTFTDSIIRSYFSLPGTSVAIVSSNCGAELLPLASCNISVELTSVGSVQDSGYVYLLIKGSYDVKNYSYVSLRSMVTVMDVILPQITSTIPVDGDISVNVSTPISINFNEPMDPQTLTSDNIKLYKVSDNSNIPLRQTPTGPSNNNQSVTFVLANGILENNTEYKLVLNEDQILDASPQHNPLGSGETTVSTFTSGVYATTTIIAVQPANNATLVSLTPAMTITFSNAMNETTINGTNIQLQKASDNSIIPVDVSYDYLTQQAILTFPSASPLTDLTGYKIVLNQTQLQDRNGQNLGANAAYTATQFITGDFTAPTLVSFSPANGLSGSNSVGGFPNISLTFSEAIVENSIVAAGAVQLQKSDGTPVPIGYISKSNGDKTYTFKPSSNLRGGTYKLIVNSTMISDTYGNKLGTDTDEVVTTFNSASRIFVTSGAWNGDLGGLGGADNKCMNDDNNPNKGNADYQYKALLGANDVCKAHFITCSDWDHQQRFPGTNWVLYPDTNYYRSDGTTLITTSTAEAKLPSSNGSWTNSISFQTEAWTGFTADWAIQTITLVDNYACDNWTVGNNLSVEGHYGNPSSTGAPTWSGSSRNCGQVQYSIYCVLQ